MKKYIEITRDGIGRVTTSTPGDIEGIYTNDLQTCLAIIFVSSNSISLIHSTFKLSEESIKREAMLHQGTLKFWTIAYNPLGYFKAYPANSDAKLREELARVVIPIEDILTKDSYLKIPGATTLRIFEAYQGFVSIDRNGNINVLQIPEHLDSPLDKDKRHCINWLNNYFSEYKDMFVPGDG